MSNFTVVIPFFNGHKTIQRLLDSLPYELPIVVIDDQSDAEAATVVYSTDCPVRNVQVIRPETKGYFTGAVNRGIEACDTDVLILNQDTYFTGRGWLDLLDEALDDYGLIGEGIQGSHPAWPVGYIHGTFMYISRRVINAIGLLNEVDYPLWGSTCEYQLRACRAGFRALPIPTIPDFHHRDTKQQRFGDAINTALEREPNRRGEFIRTPPEVSVVIPCYNYGRYLPDAINSLIAQAFQSFEVVIVDDASTDNSREIIEGLIDPWKGIRAIYLEQNLGTAGALNAGVKASYGRHIAILSADDMMKPDRLENFYRLQLQNPHSFIYDDLIAFGHDAYRIRDSEQVEDGYILKLPPYDFNQILRKNGIHAGIFYPKIAWQEAGGYPAKMGRGREDWAFNVALGLKGWCGVKCPTPGYLYRREGQNRTLSNTDFESQKQFLTDMLILYPSIYRGERPMGCCGSGPTNTAGMSSKSAPALPAGRMSLPGAEEGFEILEYIGGNMGDMTWYGPETGQRYIFGGNRKHGYVDKRDVAKMVALRDQKRPVFQVYQKPAGETTTTFDGSNGKVEETVAPPFDPASISVAVLRTRTGELQLAELEALLEAEKAGLNRKGAIAAIQEVISGLTEYA